MTDERIARKLSIVPKNPGVYLWKDAAGVVLYVGKAKILRSRVRSYQQQTQKRDRKTRLMIASARDLDWIVTESEKAALILENTLIKKYRPRYNISLRDDKNFLSIKLSIKDEFPRLYLVRRMARDGAIYYGPFSNSRAARNTLGFLNRYFLLRECRDRDFASRTRPCLNHQIGRSSAPCSGKISREDYARIVRQVRLFFGGRGFELIREVERDMEKASGELRFEDAARLRDLGGDLRRTLERQESETTDLSDRDVFALYREGSSGVVLATFVRYGKTIGQRAIPFTNLEEDDGEIIAQTVQAYYGEGNFVPPQILSPVPLGEMSDTLLNWLSELRSARVRLIVPVRGEKLRLVKVAGENARQQFEQRRARLADRRMILEEVKRALHLPKLPIMVECFDISNVQGQNAVGSKVCFVNGEPMKDHYRRYKVRSKDTPDDYAMMREVLGRRIARALREDRRPDLILVDGGRGQLSTARAVLAELGAEEIPLAAITKIKNRDPERREPEDMAYIPGRKNPITFRKGSTALFFLQRVRDEAHRFALDYHRKLRSKKQTKSVLDDIDGVGAARRKALLKRFGSVKRIRGAGVEDIAGTPGVGEALAEKIHLALKEDIRA